MLFPAEQAFVGRDEKRAPLKMPAWEATLRSKELNLQLQLQVKFNLLMQQTIL